MITIKGDLLDYFDSKQTPIAIAHVCNCKGVMGSGIALSIKERYSGAWEAYRSQNNFYLGDVTQYEHTKNKIIFNMQAQYRYGISNERFINYEYLYVCLEKVAREMATKEIKLLGVPYLMGCDRAGGEWIIVEAMLKTIEDKFGINIVTLKLK